MLDLFAVTLAVEMPVGSTEGVDLDRLVPSGIRGDIDRDDDSRWTSSPSPHSKLTEVTHLIELAGHDNCSFWNPRSTRRSTVLPSTPGTRMPRWPMRR